MTYKVIATGSTGNAVIYCDSIMIDCGVSFSAVEKHIKNIDIILLTHKHKDHINIATLKKIQTIRPSIRIGCCDWMIEHLKELKRIDLYYPNKVYNYGKFILSPVLLYHDVPNCGYRINFGDYRILHATDTAHLQGITAKGYDLYAIEHNYDEETKWDNIAAIERQGKYAHQRGSINSHLSFQQATEFIYANRKSTSEVLRLHESRTSI